MSKDIDWSKAPEGATHYDPECDAFRNKQGFYLADGSLILIPLTPSIHPRLIERPSFASWTGTGLPPVGTVCEFCDDMSDGSDWHSGLRQGMIVTVIAHFNTGFADVAAFTFMHDGSLQVEQADHLCLRPIRTQAQIEEEEREKAIQQMIEDADYDGKMVRGLFAKLHDAGYRKTEA